MVSRCTKCKKACEDLVKNPQAEQSVQCEECKRWEHFTCANVTKEISTFKYQCKECDPQGEVRQSYDNYMTTLASKIDANEDDETPKLGAEVRALLIEQGEIEENLLERREQFFNITQEEKNVETIKGFLDSTTRDFNLFETNDNSLRESNLPTTHEYYKNYKIIHDYFTDLETQLVKEKEKLIRDKLFGSNMKQTHPSKVNLGDDTAENKLPKTTKNSAESTSDANNSADIHEFMKILMNKETKGINLSKLNIPTFDSKPENWRSYREIAQIMMEDASINGIRKLLALKQSTQGEAHRLIKNIRYGPEAEKRAFNLLIGRFDNPRKMMNMELTTLFNRDKNPDIMKNIKILLDCSINVFSNSEGILRETEESLAIKENRTKKVYNTAQIKERLADILFNFCIESRFDFATSLAYEEFIEKNELQHVTIEKMQYFLELQAKKLEQSVHQTEKKYSTEKIAFAKGFIDKPKHFKPMQQSFKESTAVVNLATNTACKLCNKPGHDPRKCRDFQKLPLNERWNKIRRIKICSNCFLHPYDVNNKCKKPSNCNVKGCKNKHDTSLHYEPKKGAIQANINLNCTTELSSYLTILPTALVTLKGPRSNYVQVRALLDSGAEVSMITEKIAAHLNLKFDPTCFNLVGIGGKLCISSKGKAEVTLITIDNNEIDFKAAVVPKIAECTADRVKNLCEKIPLLKRSADSKHEGDIELLLAADVYPQIMGCPSTGILSIPSKLGLLMLGSVKAGKIIIDEKQKNVLNTRVQYPPEIKSEMEECVQDSGKIMQEEICEKLFNETTYVNKEGRIVVNLPFKQKELKDLGNSRKIALSRLFNLEKSLAKTPNIQNAYNEAIQDLFKTGQARIVANKTPGKFYLPHHGVVRDNITTKIRPVFDGSVKSSLPDGSVGKSLNDCLHTGKKLQTDIQSILINFQKGEWGIVADIRQLFLQVEIFEAHKQYLRFLFREKPNSPIKEAEFNRLVFGLSSSPWLAQASLRYAASGEPEIEEIIENSFYVDDCIKSFTDFDKAVGLINKLIKTLNEFKFRMHKFASNSKELLSKIDGLDTTDDIIVFYPEDTVSTLGIHWNTTQDTFFYSIKSIKEPSKYTKRIILSNLAGIFDPIGWICAIIVPFRLLYQAICATKIGWDDEIDESSKTKWIKLKDELHLLEQLSIPRWIKARQEDEITLIGSSDASEKCAAALIYTRVMSNEGVHIKLIAGKTKITPLGKQITLPKLELLAAEMLVNLTVKTAKALNIEITKNNITLFTDSQVVLSWLQESDIYKRKVYVANRVIRMNEKIDPSCWHYIKSEDNSADIPSRGITCSQLKEADLYWQGPKWWKLNPLPLSNENFKTELETKREFCQINVVTRQQPDIEEITNLYSDYDKLLRITALLKRWVNKKKGPISTEEIEEAEKCLILNIQQKYFQDNIKQVKKGLPVSAELKSLSPYIDEYGLLRVLGRLQHFDELPYSQKHPVILPSMFQKEGEKSYKINFILRLIEKYHNNLLHGGQKIVMAHVRNQFWIMSITKAIKHVISRCFVCFQNKPDNISQQMGPIQVERLTASIAHYNSIVDMCGPFLIKADSLRSAKTYKAYVIIFACKHTRAVHLELISSASTLAFYDALKRYVSRRGLCRTLQMDNGSNFRGVANTLEREYRKMLQDDENEIIKELAKSRIIMNFIPPYSPHINGFIERNVRSFKHHFKRVFDAAPLMNYEETMTLMIEIEGILNSKPLTSLSEDPTSYAYLTPAHLSIFRPIKPMPELRVENQKPVKRYEVLKKLSEQYWDFFKTELFAQAHPRSKWQVATRNLRPNQLILIKSTLEPKRYYKRGRILETHKGKDGVVRFATYKLASGKIEKRHCKDLILLPGESDEDENSNNEDNSVERDAALSPTNNNKSFDNSQLEEIEISQFEEQQAESTSLLIEDKEVVPRVRRSARLGKATAAALLVTALVLCTIPLTSCNPVVNFSPIEINEPQIKGITLPGGVFLARMARVYQALRNVPVRLNPQLNIGEYDEKVSLIKTNFSLLCDIITSNEKLFEFCGTKKDIVNKDIDYILRKLNNFKIIPDLNKTDLILINVDLNPPINLKLIEVKESLFELENLAVTKSLNKYHLSSLELQIRDFLNTVRDIFDKANGLLLTHEQSELVEYEVEEKLLNKDEMIFPSFREYPLNLKVETMYVNHEKFLMATLTFTICSSVPLEEWKLISIPGQYNLKVDLPHSTVIVNPDKRAYFFPREDLIRLNFNKQRSIIYDKIVYEKTKPHCILDWLREVENPSECEWVKDIQPVNNFFERVGRQSYIRKGDSSNYDLSGCGTPSENLPIGYFYFEASRNCETFEGEQENQKVFFPAEFPSLKGIQKKKYEYSLINTFHMLKQSMGLFEAISQNISTPDKQSNNSNDMEIQTEPTLVTEFSTPAEILTLLDNQTINNHTNKTLEMNKASFFPMDVDLNKATSHVKNGVFSVYESLQSIYAVVKWSLLLIITIVVMYFIYTFLNITGILLSGLRALGFVRHTRV